MNRTTFSTTVFASLLGLSAGAALVPSLVLAHQDQGVQQQGQAPYPCPMMGYGMMGPGMMGPGMSYGRMTSPEELTVDSIRTMLERNLAWQGNPRLKVGNVKEKDKDIVTAEIVTVDGSLVQRLEVDRHTGWMRQVQ